MDTRTIVALVVCSAGFFISLFGFIYYGYRAKYHKRIRDALQEIKDEMDKYGVKTFEDLEAAKAKEREAIIFPNTTEESDSVNDIDISTDNSVE